MDNLIFSLNATIPVFFMMILGYILGKVKLFDEEVAGKMNKFVFKAALPVLLFKNISTANFYEVWDTKLVVFCFVVSAVSILISILLSKFIRDTSIQGEFSQVAYRSSQALLGCAFIQNIYGDVSAATLMIIGAVPLYNVAAVMILSLMKPDRGKIDGKLMKKTAKGVITNPIILGILVGLMWSLLQIPQPEIMTKTVSNFAGLATPLGLMALGATFDYKKAFHKIKPTICCTVTKLFLFAAMFLPIAVQMGFTKDKLVAILVMLAGPSTVSCFVMAKNMGHEGTLTSSTVMMTTFFSAFSLTLWLFVLKNFGLV